MAVDASLMEQIKGLLRNSFKLAPDFEMPDDMPLVGGPIDIDSIDILLVVSNIEKTFGMKIPSEAVGRSAFATVESLAKYVADNRAILATPAAAKTAPSGISPAEALAKLPHGPEFRFVSLVREVSPGKAALAIWNVTGAELFLKGHFPPPGKTLVPGVLMTEALAQTAGIAASASSGAPAVLAAADVRFLAPVVPPASIELRAEIRAGDGPTRVADVIASVGGHAVVRGSITLHFPTTTP